MLELNLYKEYFVAIFEGRKTKEFRRNIPYYRVRIRDVHGVVKHDRIRFKNGYGKDRPYMIVELKDVIETKLLFTLCLGKILEKGNFDKL